MTQPYAHHVSNANECVQKEIMQTLARLLLVKIMIFFGLWCKNLSKFHSTVDNTGKCLFCNTFVA